MPACTCTWVTEGAPKEVELSFDQATEKLTAKFKVSGNVKTTNSNRAQGISIDVKTRLSIYRYDGNDWTQIDRGRQRSHGRDFDCDGTQQGFEVIDEEECFLDSVYLAGKDMVLLLKCYYEITGDCGNLGGFNVFKRVGLRLTTGKPPALQNQVVGGVWGTGQHTDADWLTSSLRPSDPLPP